VRSRREISAQPTPPTSSQGTTYLFAALLRQQHAQGLIPAADAARAEDLYVSLFDKAMRKVPELPVGMSASAEEIMARSRLEEWAAARRRNFRLMASAIGGIP